MKFKKVHVDARTNIMGTVHKNFVKYILKYEEFKDFWPVVVVLLVVRWNIETRKNVYNGNENVFQIYWQDEKERLKIKWTEQQREKPPTSTENIENRRHFSKCTMRCVWTEKTITS